MSMEPTAYAFAPLLEFFRSHMTGFTSFEAANAVYGKLERLYKDELIAA